MSDVAYAPKEAYRHPDALGALFVNDSTEVNVRALVEASQRDDGAFVVSDPAVQNVLDAYPAVKRVSLADEAPKTAARPHSVKAGDK